MTNFLCCALAFLLPCEPQHCVSTKKNLKISGSNNNLCAILSHHPGCFISNTICTCDNCNFSCVCLFLWRHSLRIPSSDLYVSHVLPTTKYFLKIPNVATVIAKHTSGKMKQQWYTSNILFFFFI